MKSESARVFADTNVWYYAFSEQDTELKSVAEALIREKGHRICISTQVINELCYNLRRKAGFNETQVSSIISSFYANCMVVRLNQNVLLDASALRSKYLFSFWDGLMVAAAVGGGAETFYSQDMQNGLVVDQRLTIVNPF